MPILKSITLKNFKQVLANNQKTWGDSIVVGCYRRSGTIMPTEREKKVVLKAERMIESMGIQLFDFLLLGKQDEYFSFWEARLLEKSRDDCSLHLSNLTPIA